MATDFEVLSEKSTDMNVSDRTSSENEENDNYTKDLDDDENSSDASEESTTFKNYSENSSFFHELYKDNRDLLERLALKERRIAQLQERNEFLVNSNVFWLCGTVCSMMTGFFSLLKQ